MEELDLNMDEQCRRAQIIAQKKRKGPLVKNKKGIAFDSASYELNKFKKPEILEEHQKTTEKTISGG